MIVERQVLGVLLYFFHFKFIMRGQFISTRRDESFLSDDEDR